MKYAMLEGFYNGLVDAVMVLPFTSFSTFSLKLFIIILFGLTLIKYVVAPNFNATVPLVKTWAIWYVYYCYLFSTSVFF